MKNTMILLLGLVLTIAACESYEPTYEPPDETSTFGLAFDKDEGLLEFMNNQETTTLELLDIDCAIRSDSAANLIERRDGADQVPGTADDKLFETTEEIDNVFMVGPWTMERLYECAADQGFIADTEGMLAFMNAQAETTLELLDNDCAIRSDSAANIIEHRDGLDLIAGSADDDLFDTIEELDNVFMVGPWTLERLYECASAHGWVSLPGDEPDEGPKLEMSETVYHFSDLSPQLVDIVNELIGDATAHYADPADRFPVKFGQLVIFYVDSVAVRYRVELYQTIDPEGGIQVWYKYELSPDFDVIDVNVYI